MTREQTAMILSHIVRAYPTTFKVEDKDKKGTVDTWHFLLSDYAFEDIAMALKTFVATSGSAFPPSPAELVQMTHKPTELTEMSEVEAFALVSKAVRRSTYYAEEEFAKLPEVVQVTLGNPAILREWAQTNEDEFNTVIASNFQRAYRATQAREKQKAYLPDEVRKRLELAQINALQIGENK